MIAEWEWELTGECNLACVYCIVGSGIRRAGELGLDAALNAVTVIRDLGGTVVRFTGGEPFMNPNALTIMEFCREQELRVGVLTNGTLIDGPQAARLAEVADEVGVSIDSLDERVNGTLRGHGTRSRVLAAITLLAGRIPIIAHITVSRLNIESLVETARGLAGMGVTSFRFNQLTPSERCGELCHHLTVGRDRTRAAITAAVAGLDAIEAGPQASPDTRLTANLGADGLAFSCSEPALRARWLGVPLEQAGLLSPCREPDDNCPYELLNIAGHAVCLDTGLPCPVITKGEGNAGTG